VTRAIEALLERARAERDEAGRVPLDTMMLLAGEGYMLSALDADTLPIDD
jgi:hypothetical protein